jgi:ATP-dependent RNA helicase DeaD
VLTTLDVSFSDLRLKPQLRAVLADMGITQPTPIQAQAIPPLLEGRDVVGQARTGSGKTLAYTLPLVERCDANVSGVQALVLVPTRELAIQVFGVLEPFGKALGLRATTLYGGRSLEPEKQLLRRAPIVVGTPGRTLDHLRQGNLRLQGLRTLVLDEGDEMLDKGFAPDVERILAQTPAARQTALFSATLPDWVATMVKRHLKSPRTARVDNTNEAPPEIEHTVYRVDPSQKLSALRSLLDGRGDGPVLVFGRTKHGVKKLARQLFDLGYPAAALQGNLSQNARERVMADFRSGEVQIMLATNVAARGLDVEGIERVINYELPESAELFTHRVGRTGRMGRSGEAVTFVTPEDGDKWRQIERHLGRTLPVKAWGGAPGSNGTVQAPRSAAPSAQTRQANRPSANRPAATSQRRPSATASRPAGAPSPARPAGAQNAARPAAAAPAFRPSGVSSAVRGHGRVRTFRPRSR